jgi:hypothetical protein
MSDYTYDTTEQTIAALDGIQKEVADERGVSRRFIDYIISGGKPDDYARFKHKLFKPVLRVEPGRVWGWIDDLLSLARAEEESLPKVERFPSRAVFNMADRELNMEEIERVPTGERIAALDEVIHLLTAYRDGLRFHDMEDGEDSRGEDGPERAVREATPPRPVRAAARS